LIEVINNFHFWVFAQNLTCSPKKSTESRKLHPKMDKHARMLKRVWGEEYIS